MRVWEVWEEWAAACLICIKKPHTRKENAKTRTRIMPVRVFDCLTDYIAPASILFETLAKLAFIFS